MEDTVPAITGRYVHCTRVTHDGVDDQSTRQLHKGTARVEILGGGVLSPPDRNYSFEITHRGLSYKKEIFSGLWGGWVAKSWSEWEGGTEPSLAVPLMLD